MSKRITMSVLAVLLAAAPAVAAPICSDSRQGLYTSFSVEFGAPYTEQEMNELDLKRLKQLGVDATDVERWSGCLRAYVRTPNGIEMQFYDPNTFQRVQ